jgi:hypothetical protein
MYLVCLIIQEKCTCIYLEGSCSNVAVMSRIQQFSNRKNVAVMSCKFLQCRGNVFLPFKERASGFFLSRIGRLPYRTDPRLSLN